MTGFCFPKKKITFLKKQLKYGEFGASTKGLYGEAECSLKGDNNLSAKKRYQIYLGVLRVFDINEKPIETGCYNVTIF